MKRRIPVNGVGGYSAAAQAMEGPASAEPTLARPRTGADVETEPAGQAAASSEPTAESTHRVDEIGPDAEIASQESLRRAYDELEAAKRRLQRDAKRQQNELREKLVAELLPVVDNLDRSLDACQAPCGAGSDSALADGVRLVRKQLMGVLEGYGVERLTAVGQPFDPRVHDAIATVAVDDAAKDGVVVDEWQPGYRLAGKVVRPAKVRVGKLS